MRPAGETKFAIFTLCLIPPYFLGETYYTYAFIGFDTYILDYIVDLIVMALLLLASVASLKHKQSSAAGWLAAAWGFAACLNYRAFTWRYYEFQDSGTIGREPSAILYLIGGAMILTFGALIYSLYLSRPRR